MRTWSVQKQDFGVKCELFGAKTKYLVFTNLVCFGAKTLGMEERKTSIRGTNLQLLDNSEQNSSFLVLKRCQKGQKQDFGAK